jgi:hypothetical protein
MQMVLGVLNSLLKLSFLNSSSPRTGAAARMLALQIMLACWPVGSCPAAAVLTTPQCTTAATTSTHPASSAREAAVT